MRALLCAVALAGGATIAIVGCLKRPTFQCASATECDGVGAGATCEADGFCSFNDDGCASGRRYGDNSGPNSGQCVGDVGPPPDGPPADGEPDGPLPDARQCFGGGAYEVCLTTAPTGSVDLAGALDTTTDTRCLGSQPSMWTINGQPDACFIVAETITVTASIGVTGTRPLVLVGPSINVNALLDVASHRGAAPGAAANATQCGGFVSDAFDATPVAAGGAGGSFMTGGGDGGNGNNNAGIPGGVAAPADGAAPTVLRGGCAGQIAGDGAGVAGPPGAGGGVVFLAATTITLTSSGTINASGAGGSAGGDGAGGSGGGGGGMIVLHADTISGNGRLLANGGGGASGGRDNSGGVAGADPNPAMVGNPAAGGVGQGANGGAGFAGGSAALDGSAAGGTKAGGGGGGGGGYIQSNKALTGASVSPAATVVP